MFNFISGTIDYKQEGIVVIENNGIGYELNISNNTLVTLGSLGEWAKLYTYFQVKEDGVSLFGFSSFEEKEMFLLLISVSGIGPKMGLSLLSGMKLSDLKVAIKSNDINLISRIKGCGKKTAERICVELKDKINVFSNNQASNNDVGFIGVDEKSIDEAVGVLVSLGISKQEAEFIVKTVAENGNSTEEIITKAIKNIGR